MRTEILYTPPSALLLGSPNPNTHTVNGSLQVTQSIMGKSTTYRKSMDEAKDIEYLGACQSVQAILSVVWIIHESS